MSRFWLSLLLVLACREEPSPAPAARAALPPGVVARVAGKDVSTTMVQRIVGTSGVAPEVARDRAILDALFALEAIERLSEPMRATVERAAHGRALLEALLVDAERKGPATDAEVDRLTSERWVELDRPPSARVTHAVALLDEKSDGTAARRVATAIAEAVRGHTEPKAFADAAKRVPTEGVEVRVERLPPMTADGRGFQLDAPGPQPPQSFDPVFAEAANALTTPGEQSKVIETRFGFHVLLLEAKLPELRLAREDRRRILAREIMSRRAAESRRALVDSLTARMPVEVARDFDARTAGLGAP